MQAIASAEASKEQVKVSVALEVCLVGLSFALKFVAVFEDCSPAFD